MNSIRRKLFSQLGSIMILFVLLLYIANNLFLETLYIASAKSTISAIYEELNTIDPSEFTSEKLYDIVVNSGFFLDIIVIDEENQKLYSPSNPLIERESDTSIPRNGPRPDDQLFVINKTDTVDENNAFMIITEDQSNKSFLMFDGQLENGYSINIRVAMDSIGSNVTFFNQFILGAGVIIFLLSLIASNILSKHFTTPILNIFNTTDRLKKMDFSTTCEVTTNDELGRLAQNINEMSYVLETNLNELALSNSHLQEEINERLKIDEQRKALLNNVSHELKTPLSLVQGYSEGLKLNLRKNVDKADTYCDVIIDEAKKMDALVSQLLDINRLQFGDFPLHKETRDAADFIHYVTRKYKPLFKNAGISFTEQLSCLTTSKTLSIDALRSEQVLTNLFNNAIAYTDNQKQLLLSCLIRPSDTVTSKDTGRTSMDHPHLRLTIANSYEQVQADELENWWDSFYKVDQARTRDNGGYGLGLSIIKAIQEADHNLYGVYYEKGMIHFYIDLDLVEA